jgi:hypothetical protein
MMGRFNLVEYRRRGLVPLAVLGLACYYLLVFLPLSRHAASFDAPLQREWQKLAASLDQSNALALDFSRLTNQLAETRQSLLILDGAKQKARANLELGPALRAKLSAPFQLVEYQNERGKQMDELVQLAKQHKATIDPAVLAGYPEHTADVKQPTLLWPALSFVNGLLTTAVEYNVSAVNFLEVPVVLTNAPPSDPSGRLAEIPFQVELTGPFASVARLLQSLPLRAEEIRAAGLLEKPPDRPPLYLRRLLIKKQSPDKPDEVRVWLRVVGFVARE